MNQILVIVVVVIVLELILDTVVDAKNVRHVRDDLPDEFADVFDAARYRKSQAYLKTNTRFSFLVNGVEMPLLLAFVLLGGFSWVDQFARSFQWGEIATGLVFAGVLLAGSSLLSLPFSVVRTFVIEERFGFNRTTPTTFVLDRIKGWLLTVVVGAPVFALVIFFFQSLGDTAWLVAWGALTTIQLFLALVAPVVIMPLFNKFTPLPDGELRSRIDAYARSQDFKLEGIYTMDGSRRSSKSNAYFTGFGQFRRIVLFDTLVEKHTPDELVAVLAHEMGHFKLGHIWKGIVVSILTTGLMFFLLSLFIGNRMLFNAFQVQQVSIYGALLFFGFLFSPIQSVLSVLGNLLSRKHEYEADAYARRTLQTGEGLIQALKKLSADNLSNLTPHPWKVFLEYSHPPVLERIRALRNEPQGAN